MSGNLGLYKYLWPGSVSVSKNGGYPLKSVYNLVLNRGEPLKFGGASLNRNLNFSFGGAPLIESEISKK